MLRSFIMGITSSPTCWMAWAAGWSRGVIPAIGPRSQTSGMAVMEGKLVETHQCEVTVLESAIAPDAFPHPEQQRPAEDRPVVHAGVELAAFTAGVYCAW